MDGQKGQAKLTRTHSSLLRSSPTVRSSVHSLASVAEEDYLVSSSDEEKKAKKSPKPALSFKPGSTRFAPVLAVTSLTLFAFVYFFYHYKKLDETPTSENLLLALIFIAVALFFFSKHRTLINRSFSILRRWSEENANWIGLSRTNSKPVQWSIGDSDFKKVEDEEESRLVKEGVICYTNGDIYEGEFHKGKCNGSGVYNYFSSGRYEGDWVDGKYDGYGIESWSRGSRYRGQYRQGLRHGYGVYRLYTGDTYAGEWCNGQSQGIGVQTCSDGSCYVGQFKFGVKHGLGCYHFRNGDRYSGEYFGDKVHGFGVYHFANGHCYEGSWHEGRKQGYGMYTFRNSDARCGEWDCGNLKTPLLPLSEPALRAVQAARRTADSAIHLRRVDGEVNKAVMAANRAATAARVAAVKAVQNRMEGKFCDTDFLDSSFV